MATATEIRDALERLAELDEEAAAAVRDAWPCTLAVLDEPDGTIVEIPLRARAETDAAMPLVNAGAKYDIATLRRQLADHVNDELARLTA